MASTRDGGGGARRPPGPPGGLPPQVPGTDAPKGPPSPRRRRPAPGKPRGPLPAGGLRPPGPLVFLGGIGGGAALGCMVGLLFGLARLPSVASLQSYTPFQTTKVYDRHNLLIANFHGDENRVVVPLRDIPKTMQDAVISVEDSDFYAHHGINFKSLVRALVTDMLHHRKVEGGSTLTQQLAKNLFLSSAKALPRKIAEAYLALQIEHRFSKPQILELYLNQVYWGHSAYGIEAASRTYFGIGTKKLDLAQSAMLAGMLRGPSLYSPYLNPRLAKYRQHIVLARMVETNHITQVQADAADQEALKYSGVKIAQAYQAPYFMVMLEEELLNRYGADAVLRGGLRVVSTLDWDLQQRAEELVRGTVDTQGRRYGFSQAALVAIDPKNGAIRAMVGGVDFNKSKFNRVIQALRQPGSSFKPFVYLTAFSQGWSPEKVLNDDPVSYPAGNGQEWTPHNYDGEYYGDLTLRQALWKSNNVVAVKVAHAVGISNVIDTAHRLGISSPLGVNLSLALGTSEVTPLELASAYGVLANDGVRVEPYAYGRVEDRAGTALEVHTPIARRVFDAEPVRTMVDVMKGVVERGTGAAAYFGRPAAGKTGTTSDHRDAWFVGFTPDLVTAVWVGNDDNHPMSGGTTGGEVCAPLWNKFMKYAMRDVPVSDFPAPPHVAPPAPDHEASESSPAATGGAAPEPEPSQDFPGQPAASSPPDGTLETAAPTAEPGTAASGDVQLPR